MKEDSIDKAREEIIKGLDGLKIDMIDKVELMRNISRLLKNKEVYEESIKTLKLTNKRGKKNGI